MTKAIIYIRTSTSKQAKSGLGLEDQTNKCLTFCEEREMQVLDIYCDSDVSGKIDPDQRPALSQALQRAKEEGAKIIIKSLCRISREVYHVSGLMRHNVDFVVCDHPDAPSFLLHILASMNQFEREQISKRTKDALAVAKERGVKLGSNNPIIRQAASKGKAKQSLATLHRCIPHIHSAMEHLKANNRPINNSQIANVLNDSNVETPSGKGKWQSKQVARLLKKWESEG